MFRCIRDDSVWLESARVEGTQIDTWTANLGVDVSQRTSLVRVRSGKVMTRAGDTVYCFDARTGVERWREQLDFSAPPLGDAHFSGIACYQDFWLASAEDIQVRSMATGELVTTLGRYLGAVDVMQALDDGAVLVGELEEQGNLISFVCYQLSGFLAEV